MNSKEIVKKTIHFGKPERLPYFVNIDMERFEEERTKEEVDEIKRMQRQAKTDFIWVDIKVSKYWKPKESKGYYHSLGTYTREEREDEWNVIWKELRAVKHPLSKSWSLLSKYTIPDPFAPGRFDEAKEIINNNKDKYLVGFVWFTLFERLWMLRGFNNMLLDPYTNYNEFVKLRNAIHNYNLGITRQWLELGIDGIFISDDWGSQKSLLVNPDYWREFYKPCYKELFDLIHSGGADVWMHSDGNLIEIMPDFIELGLDVLNPVQPQASVLIGPSYLLPILAGAFIGGVSLAGGEGSPHGAVLGGFAVYLIENIIVVLAISAFWKEVATGLFLFLFVLFDFYQKRRRIYHT